MLQVVYRNEENELVRRPESVYFGRLSKEREIWERQKALREEYAVEQHEYWYKGAICVPVVEGEKIVFRRRSGEMAFELAIAGGDAHG